MDNQINIHPTGESLVIREGKAPELIEPIGTDLAGDITAPANYFTTKEADIDNIKANLIVNRGKMKVRLFLNTDQENHRKIAIITGEITINPKFEEFKINRNWKWELKALSDFLKFNRRYFPDLMGHTNIVTGLRNFSASVSKEIQASSDDRGNARSLRDKRVSTNMPETFTLQMSIFKNGPVETFDVEICIEETEGLIRAWLQSVTADDLMESKINEMIDLQLARFEGKVTVIEQ